MIEGRRGTGAETGRHIYGLDLLRVWAAVLVALLHFSFEYRPLAFIPPVGWVGVEIFFVLSGFVIAESLTGSSPQRFVTSRLLRLYPTAWGCTIVGASAVLIFGGAHVVVGDLATLDPRSFIDSLALFGGRFLSSAYWTLQIELAFYAFCLLYFILCPPQDVSRLAKILIIWATPYIVLLVSCRLGAFEVPWLDFGNGVRNVTLLRHGPLFALGLLIWQATRTCRAKRVCPGWIVSAIVLSCGEIACRSIELAPRSVGDTSSLAMAAMTLSLWGTACVAILASVRWNERYPRHAGLRALTQTVGLITYPFYLIHQSAGGSVMGFLIEHGSSDAAALTAGLLVSLLLSWAILTFWDPMVRPAMKRVCASIAAAIERHSRPAQNEISNALTNRIEPSSAP